MSATLTPYALALLVGVPASGYVLEPEDLPEDNGPEPLSDEQSLYLSTPFLCDACGEDDCDGDCTAAYLLSVRGRCEKEDGAADWVEMLPTTGRKYDRWRDDPIFRAERAREELAFLMEANPYGEH